MRGSLLVSAAVLCLATYDSSIAAAPTSNSLLKSDETSSVLGDHDAVASDTDPKHQRFLRHLEAEIHEIPAPGPAAMASNVSDFQPKKVVPFGLQPFTINSGPPSGTETTSRTPELPSGKQTVTTNPTAPVERQTVTTNPTAPVERQTANPNPTAPVERQTANPNFVADDVDEFDSSDSSSSSESSKHKRGPFERVAAKLSRMAYGKTYKEWMQDDKVTRSEAKAKLYDLGLSAEISDPMEALKEMGYIAYLDKKCALPENNDEPACL